MSKHNHDQLKSQFNYFFKAQNDTLWRIPNGKWSLFSISIVYHLRFIGLKGLGQMPHYGQHKSSHELTNTGQKSPYLELTQFTISWAPISKGQRWEILCIKEHCFLKKILRKYGFLTNIPLSTQLALQINSPDGEGYLGQCFSSFHVPINYLGFLLNCQFQFWVPNILHM